MALASSAYRQRHQPLIVLAANFHGSKNQKQKNAASSVKLIQNTKDAAEKKSPKRWLTYNHTSKPTPESVRERNQTVSSYYNQTAIDEACQQNSVKLAPSTIMYTSRSKDGSHILKSAQYLRR